MKKIILIPFLSVVLLPAFAQKHASAFNFGIEIGSDFLTGAGISPLKKADNPLVSDDYFKRQGELEAGFYAEYLHLHHLRKPNNWGNKIAPNFGIKFNPNWTFFRANNSDRPNITSPEQAVGLNYANFPLLLEYCFGYRQGVTRSSYTHGTLNAESEYDELSNSVHTTVTNTPGQYNPGGLPASHAWFIYAGPQISYLFKSDNYTGSPIKDPNLTKTYIGVMGGIAYENSLINLDLSYEKGLTSIYTGKNVIVNGWLLRLGINFGRRAYIK